MPQSCLDNLVYIKGTCTPQSGSMCINNLPAITLKNMDSVISEEQRSGIALITEKIGLAQDLLIQDIENHYSDKIRRPSVIDNGVVGFYRDDLENVAAMAGYYKGIEIIISDYPYLQLEITKVRLQLPIGQTTTIKVFDLMQNKELDSFDITNIANEINEVEINKTYATNKQRMHLFIGYVASVASIYAGIDTFSGNGCYPCALRGTQMNPYVFSVGSAIPTGSSKIGANMQPQGDTGGMSITYSLKCHIAPFICSIKNMLAIPLWWRVGAMLLEESYFSQRLNSFVMYNKEKHAELYEKYMRNYNSSLFGGEDADGRMNAGLLPRLQLPKDECFMCTPRVRTDVVIP